MHHIVVCAVRPPRRHGPGRRRGRVGDSQQQRGLRRTGARRPGLSSAFTACLCCVHCLSLLCSLPVLIVFTACPSCVHYLFSLCSLPVLLVFTAFHCLNRRLHSTAARAASGRRCSKHRHRCEAGGPAARDRRAGRSVAGDRRARSRHAGSAASSAMLLIRSVQHQASCILNSISIMCVSVGTMAIVCHCTPLCSAPALVFCIMPHYHAAHRMLKTTPACSNHLQVQEPELLDSPISWSAVFEQKEKRALRAAAPSPDSRSYSDFESSHSSDRSDSGTETVTSYSLDLSSSGRRSRNGSKSSSSGSRSSRRRRSSGSHTALSTRDSKCDQQQQPIQSNRRDDGTGNRRGVAGAADSPYHLFPYRMFGTAGSRTLHELANLAAAGAVSRSFPLHRALRPFSRCRSIAAVT